MRNFYQPAATKTNHSVSGTETRKKYFNPFKATIKIVMLLLALGGMLKADAQVGSGSFNVNLTFDYSEGVFVITYPFYISDKNISVGGGTSEPDAFLDNDNDHSGTRIIWNQSGSQGILYYIKAEGGVNMSTVAGDNVGSNGSGGAVNTLNGTYITTFYQQDNRTGAARTKWNVTNDNIGLTRVDLYINKLNRRGSLSPKDEHNVTKQGNTISPIDRLGNLKISSHIFINKDNATLSWSSNNNQMSKQSVTKLYRRDQLTSTLVYTFSKGVASGSYTVPQSDKATTYYLVQEAYDGRVSIQSADYTLPAFTHARNLTVKYNETTEKSDISWEINSVANTEMFEQSGFVVQRATKADFSDAVKVGITVPYDRFKTTYTINDDFKTDVYYRVYRDYNPSTWNKADAISTFYGAHAGITAASGVQLILDNVNVRDTLKWTPGGLWSSGASFIIMRYNKSSGASTAITLAKEDYEKGVYVDDLITPCNEYYYTLQVKTAAGSGYPTLRPFQTTNTVTPVTIGTVNNLTTSKGYYPNRTSLEWQTQGAFDNYIVQRRIYGSNDNFVQIVSVPGGGSSTVQYEDERGQAGVYYEYRVMGAVKCNNEMRYSKDTLYAVGFRSPTGTIYGRITFPDGQAVENVAVRLESSDNTPLGKSILLDGSADSYLKIDSLNRPFADSAFTIETWVKPTDAAPQNQIIFSRENQYTLGFNATGKIYFDANNATVSTDYQNPDNKFMHIAAVREKDSLKLYINGERKAAVFAASSVSSNAAKGATIGSNGAGKNFKGNIDEMRIWNSVLDSAALARDYTRMLGGGENGLVAYWRFDETVKDQFYDISYQGNDSYNRNDGTMKATAVQRSAIVPATSQLSLKGYTDITGNYMISGVTYIGNGTTYKITPLYGTHQFEPATVNRLVSASANTFTIDFSDKSFFPVQGYVYYRNSTVPVSGVNFMIDGKYAQSANGSLMQTDETGRFEISVPVGVHEVKAVKANHIFDNNGKLTDRLGNDLNYQAPVSQRILYDNTTVRFIGRVAGGTVQENMPLGHSVSKNNLGEELKVTLQLSGAQNRKLNASGKDSTVTVKHFLPSDKDSAQINSSSIVYKDYSIEINANSKTGEFFADIIPEVFNITSATATGHDDLVGNNPIALDLTNKFSVEKSGRSWKDSTQNQNGSWAYKNYNDSLSYNASYKFIKRNNPQLSIVQLSWSDKELPYFGDTTYSVTNITGELQPISLYDRNNNSYLFGHPVWQQGLQYNLGIQSYELYPYYKKDDLKNPLSTDKVPTQGGLVSFVNDIRVGSSAVDTLSMDENGKGIYRFVAGEPELSDGIGLKGFSATIQVGAQNIAWNNGQKKMGYVMGGRKTGTDFVTSGPDAVMWVLRDPPGANSYSWIEKGTSFTRSSQITRGAVQSGDITVNKALGGSIKAWTGVGAGVIKEVEIENNIGLSVSHEEQKTFQNETTVTTTFLTNFQTSSAPDYVGAAGDLFIGNSSNINLSQTLDLRIVRNTEVAATDQLFFDGTNNNSAYSIVQRDGINIAQEYGTLFVYPEKHIENILIPKLKEIQKSILLPNTITDKEAEARAIFLNKEVYVSVLPASHPNFGKLNTDEVFGKDTANALNNPQSYKIFKPSPSFNYSDTLVVIHNNIKNWEDRLADNEKTKLDTKNKFINNYSFTGGASISESLSMSHTKTHTQNFNILVGGGLFTSFGIKADKSGVSVSISETAKAIYDSTKTSAKEDTQSFGFQLSENGTNYISVDVLRAPDSSYVFRTKGGQTACPYQGAVYSKYYQPGAVIDEPTIQVEKPVITVDQSVVANIPSNKSATYTIRMSNASEAKTDATFEIKVLDESNPYGAKIFMDGTELGRGRVIRVPYGDRLTKTLTLERGADSMDYRNIQIVLQSECDAYLIESVDNSLADTISLSAHFIPSCSFVNIKSPVNNWVLNTLSLRNSSGSRYLPITIDGFDVNQSLFDHIELQYKPAADANWITVNKFYASKAKFDAAEGSKQMITENGVINYNLVMTDAAFSDQNYNVRAVGFCMDNGQVIATSSSELINGIKDTYAPRLFGSPQPANGVLGIADNIQLNFNEQIAQGLLSVNNFQVTGVRNGAKSDHSVAVTLDGQADYVATEFDKNLTGKDITAEMWILPNGAKNQTIFSQGNINETMEMALTADNHLQLVVGNKTIISDKPVNYKPGEWAHVAMKYDATRKLVSAYYNFIEAIHEVSTPEYNATGHFEFGRSISKQGNLFAGKMHEARVWSTLVTPTNLQVNSLTQLSGYENALLAYYPMKEGKGKIVYDKARGANAKLRGNWSTPAGKSVALKGNGYVSANTAYAPITREMDYTIELWFKGAAGQANATLLSNGRGDATDFETSKKFNLGFENSKLTFTNNGFSVQADGDYQDNQWHHLAVAVNRNSGVAQLYVDGVMNKFFDAKNLGSLENASMSIGARMNFDNTTNAVTHDRFFNGNIDEVRIWNTYLQQDVISRNNNIRLAGNEMGLLAYYPFEKYYMFQNNFEMDSTLNDMKIQKDPNAQVPIAKGFETIMADDKAPIVDRGPVANLQFSYVVNNDKLIINMLEPKQAIDKTIVTIRAEDIRDMNGNPIESPVTWTAYINQNVLKWSDESLVLSKDINKPMTFTSYIVNSGGNMQNFRLNNLPNWLKASPAVGSINPLGKQEITFTVNQGLNVGNYDEVIYMSNDNNEVEALPLALKVKGNEPDWKVNPADFKYSMTVYGKMRINNIFSADKEDILAAFENGKCIGVVRNTYDERSDMWYAFLTVYNNNLTAENIKFRMWQSSTGKVFEATPSVKVSFANDAIVGTVANPVIFDGKEMKFSDIALKAGWNWISFNLLNSELNNMNATLANGSWKSGDIVKNQTGFNQFSDASSGWLGTLSSGFNNTSMFMLNSSTAQTLSIAGTSPDLSGIPITVRGARWNYISYLPAINMTVTEALAGYNAESEDVIKSQTGFAMYDAQRGWVGNLQYLEPGKGYMLYRKNGTDVTFRYGNLGGSLNTQSVVFNKQRMLEMPVASTFRYAENMTLLAKVDENFRLTPADKVVAYIGGEKRAEGFALNDSKQPGLLLFNIVGKTEMPVTFVVERNGNPVAEAVQTFNYTSNTIAGTLDKPYLISFTGKEDDVQVYPNPFTNRLNIKATAAENISTVKVTVYDVTGRKVYEKADNASGRNYTATWDGRSNTGANVMPGIYLVEVMIDGKKQTIKVVKQ